MINTNINGAHFVLSAIKEKAPECKFYFAASSEMFGKARETPQNENTPFHPRSPYGISKVAGFDLTRNYREAYGMYACNGILFNHESPRRGFEFVTRKISNKEFAEVAFRSAGLDWKDYVVVDKMFYRPSEVHVLRGDYSKGNEKLGWEPAIRFEAIVKMMVVEDIALLKRKM